MAKGRMISRKCAWDEDLNRCSVEAQLLHARILPHLDDFGRIEGSAAAIRAQCVPLLEQWSTEFVERLLTELHECGLVERYWADGRLYAAYLAFDRHQVNLHKRTRSDFPAPEDGEPLAGYASRNLPEFPGRVDDLPGRVRARNLTEPKGTERNGMELNQPGTSGTRKDTSVAPSTPARRARPPAQPTPDDANEQERGVLLVLQSIPGWPADGAADLELVRGAAADYPDVNLKAVARDLKAGYADAPIVRGAHPRAKFRTYVRHAHEWAQQRGQKDGIACPPARAAPAARRTPTAEEIARKEPVNSDDLEAAYAAAANLTAPERGPA